MDLVGRWFSNNLFVSGASAASSLYDAPLSQLPQIGPGSTEPDGLLRLFPRCRVSGTISVRVI